MGNFPFVKESACPSEFLATAASALEPLVGSTPPLSATKTEPSIQRGPNRVKVTSTNSEHVVRTQNLVPGTSK